MPRLILHLLRLSALIALCGLAGCATTKELVAKSKEPPADVDIVIVAGQSNAVGFDSDPSKLPRDSADKKILFWWRCGDPLPDDHDSTSGGKWTRLQPQPRGNPIQTNKPFASRQYGNFANPKGGFGPEISFARALYHKEGRNLAVVKVAFSGTGMRTGWNPLDPGDGGACYRSLLKETQTAIAAAQLKGLKPHVRALVWVQGESDANAGDAPNYAKSLASMLDALRKGLNEPKMIALLGINTRNGEGKNPFIRIIIEAQKFAAALDSRAAYVDTSAATIANDAHWNTKGTLAVGAWFAEALWKMETPVKAPVR